MQLITTTMTRACVTGQRLVQLRQVANKAPDYAVLHLIACKSSLPHKGSMRCCILAM